jgi:putative ABC transport system permease protein
MGLTDWFRRRPSDEDMRAELEAHLAMRAEHDGADDAAARARLGGELRTREEMRDVWRWAWAEAIAQDVRFTLHAWRRHPGFAAAAIATLALGLGAATGMFSMVDRILFRPLPYPDGSRIVSVGLMAPLDANEFLLSPDYLQLWRETPRAFAAVTTVTAGTSECDLTEERPERLTCARAEWNLLSMLRLPVAAGRDLRQEDGQPGAAKVALISYGLWLRRYGGDAGVQGKRLMLDGEPVEIAGVLPRDFELPTLASADLVLPQQLAQPVQGRPAPMTFLRGFARLKPGITVEAAQASLQNLFVEMLKNVPPMFRKEVMLRVRPLRDRQVGDARRGAWMLLAAVGALLLIACVNVANLLLARMAAREQELAVRSSLGASRGRLVGLVMTESMMLAASGAAAGLGIAYGVVRLFVSLAPAGIPKLAEAAIDGRVMAASAGLALVAALLIGLWPAFSVSRLRAIHGRRTTGVRPWTRFALVATQIAFTFALLGSCSLLLRSLWNLQSVALGFETGNVFTASITLNQAKYRAPEQQIAFFDQLLERASRAPGVQAVALSDSLPPLGAVRTTIYSRTDVQGRPSAGGGTGGMVTWRSVTPGYLEALRIPIVQGRRFTPEDRNAPEPAMILSEKLARRMFPTGDALGQRLRPGGEGQPWHIVVGVSRDTRNVGPAAESEPEYYVVRRPVARDAVRRSFLVVRASGASAGTITAWLRAEIANLDPALPMTFQTLEDRAGELSARPRFTAWLLAAFAGLALALASMGLAGVASYLVTQRTRDIGVRMALGATPGDIRSGVLGEAGRWIAVGAALGAGMAWATAQYLTSFLHGVHATDPLTWAVVLLILSASLVMAVLYPARRAARVDPMRALRSE